MPALRVALEEPGLGDRHVLISLGSTLSFGANLSCLGLLSDRVLRRYVPLEARRQIDSKEAQHA
jgi:hypothetical protein